MDTVFIGSTVVIVANDVNLSIFKPPWLTKTEIFNESELSGNVIISPVAVQIPTKNFGFAVFPNRMQVTIPRNYADAQSDLMRILGGIVQALPHTPYSGVGLNFNYLCAPAIEDTFATLNRKLFASDFANSIVPVDDDASRYGTYFSFDALDGRLKIDIKPTKGEGKINELHESWHRGHDLMAINYNLHYDVQPSEKSVARMIQIFSKWQAALSLTEEMTNKITD